MTEDETGGEEDEEDAEVNENRDDTNETRAQRKSPMELLAMCSPMIHVSCLVYPLFYVLNLDMPFLLISAFPDESRNFFIICLCLAWETFIFSVLLAWAAYAIFAITSFILTFEETVDLVMQRISIR